MLAIRNQRQLWGTDVTAPVYLLDDYEVPYRLIRLILTIAFAGASNLVVKLQLLSGDGELLWQSVPTIAGQPFTVYAGGNQVILFDEAPPFDCVAGGVLVHACIPPNLVVLENQRLRVVIDGAVATVPAVLDGDGNEVYAAVPGTSFVSDMFVGVVVDV